MSLEQITQAVLGKAQAEADRIVKAAQLSAKDKVDASRRTVPENSELRYLSAVRAINSENSRKLMRIMGDVKKQILSEKGRCMRRVFDSARTKILALPDDDYLDVMQRLLERAAEGYKGTLRVHYDEVQRFNTLLQRFNAERVETARVTLDEATFLQEPGGFVFSCDRYHVDSSLQVLLQNLEYELAPHVAAALLNRLDGE